MPDRFFVEKPIEQDRAQLAGPEAHHLAHVMRAKPGETVLLFDGSGCEFTARIERVGRATVDLAVTASARLSRELPAIVILAVALPKGDRQRWLVEKAVELGVAQIVPLRTERSNDRETAGALDRLRRAVVEASKQCGRNTLLEIGEPVQSTIFFAAEQPAAARLLAQPEANSAQQAMDHMFESHSAPAEIVLAVGPEGGFTPAEIVLATSCGWQSVGLGPRILRVETAALALVGAIMLRLEGRAVTSPRA